MDALNHILEQIKTQGVASNVKRYQAAGEPEPYYGTTMGTLTKLAKPHFKDNDLAKALWETEILEAQLVAVQVAAAKALDEDTLWQWCNPKVSIIVLDKLANHLISVRKDANDFEERLLGHDSLALQRMGWSLTIRRIVKRKLSEEQVAELFDKIKATLPGAEEPLKWTVNHTLCELGVYYDDWTERAIEFGEANGAYKDQVVAKGCTSSYAPEWIPVARRNRKARMKK